MGQYPGTGAFRDRGKEWSAVLRRSIGVAPQATCPQGGTRLLFYFPERCKPRTGTRPAKYGKGIVSMSETVAAAKKPINFTGIQPSGKLTLGNNIGALSTFSLLQDDYD